MVNRWRAYGVSDWFADDDEDGYGDVEDMVTAWRRLTNTSQTTPTAMTMMTTSIRVRTNFVMRRQRLTVKLTRTQQLMRRPVSRLDGDGYGIEVVSTVSWRPQRVCRRRRDCNDGDTDYYPGADEDDCSDPADYNRWVSGYDDVDGDGYAAVKTATMGLRTSIQTRTRSVMNWTMIVTAPSTGSSH